ncbi:hypothetical protein RHMOL_Rhmol10G0078400 [Rhododendron molle]|uniref:Uncharacterized protein n=1 Tax=Rhododendron molle TaxID=49168 RepID=A0ACC0M057_RHOML|nr:hypothetical protein RHMOL_Rhmol10G0078400 [Rhododendron molle]
MAPLVSHLRFTRLLFSSAKPPFKTLPISAFSTITKNQTPPYRRKTFSHMFQECSNRRAADTGKQAHASMIVSGFEPTIFVTNCLIQMYIKCSSLDYALKVFGKTPERDTVSWNAMVFGYAGCGNMEAAQSMFDSMPEKDVVSWNSLISGYVQNGNNRMSIDVFLKMTGAGVESDRRTFSLIFKACSALENYDVGIQVHGLAVPKGFDHDVVSGSAIVDMYAKCRKLGESLQFFREMPERNCVSWSAVIAGCVQNEELVGGLELFKEMQQEGVGISQSTYASILRSCAGLSAVRLGAQFHAHAIKAGFQSDIIVGTATLDMYAKCDCLLEARKIFNSLPTHNLQSYNAMIIGYAQCYRGLDAFQVFRLLMKSGFGFDDISLSGALSACAMMKGYLAGIQVHGLAIKSIFWTDVCVANAILDMYGKCGALMEAHFLFDEMEIRDAVSWNAIIAAYGQNGYEEATLSLFVWMLRWGMEPDDFTYGSVLKACAGGQALNCGMEVHNRVIKSGMGFDLFVGSAIVDMYCKCAKVEEAEKLHDRMEEQQSMVSWNAMISGFSSAEKSEEAQKFFSRMLEMGVKPDSFTYATVLDTCANLATVGLGKQIHAQIIKHELQSDVFISSTLVDMYSKCGNMQDSRLMFDKSPKRDFVTWNALICGYTQHGLGEEALRVFDEMQVEGVKPDHATFVSVLRVCAHMGLVEKGLHYFYSMSSDFGLDPQLEHFSCIVDILGRSGQVSHALRFIHEMPFQADDVIWRTLLSICKMHGAVEVAEEAANSLLRLDPHDSSAYILLSNIYADAGMWDQVSKMRRVMKCSGMKKEPGCSWIEVKSNLHMFLVGDKAHPRREQIYENLDLLLAEMKWAGYVPDTDFVLLDEDTEGEHVEELILCTS